MWLGEDSSGPWDWLRDQCRTQSGPPRERETFTKDSDRKPPHLPSATKRDVLSSSGLGSMQIPGQAWRCHGDF